MLKEKQRGINLAGRAPSIKASKIVKEGQAEIKVKTKLKIPRRRGVSSCAIVIHHMNIITFAYNTPLYHFKHVNCLKF